MSNPTIVTGTIVDPGSIPYYPATVTATLTPTTINPTANGKPINPNPGVNMTVVAPTNTDGSFTMSLFANSAISPGSTQWLFTVTTNGEGRPSGFGSLTFAVAITVSGTTQDVGTTLSASAPALLQVDSGGGGGGSVVLAPTADQTITGAHALIMSDADSTFYVGTDDPFGGFGDTGQGFFGVPESSQPAAIQGYFGEPAALLVSNQSTGGSEGINVMVSGGDVSGGVQAIWAVALGDGANGIEADVISTGPGTGGAGTAFAAAIKADGATATEELWEYFGIQPFLSNGAVPSKLGGIHLEDMTAGGSIPAAFGIEILGGKNDLGPGQTKVGSLAVVTSTITSGTGSPETVVTAPVGSLYLRTDGGATTSLYVKTSGAGNTGWTGK